ncbi:hypothetical protein COV82_03995 [Candidatus Peregrinibacteria bacterium CG11_big_fil_rev_8_21_14_0_20_46_8]|nr:MAG: hypothetical protein COV82_03995 [Candidatus Peregrinibacteria bacterium CG11_big_fil_rev_8_21_14_0_20_46_8]
MENLLKLGIDPISILVYILNAGLVLIVLTYLLYKPLLRFIDQRRKQIADSVEEARVIRDDFSKQLEESREEKKKVEAELRTEITNLQKFLDKKRHELVAEMEAARTEMMQKGHEELAQRKAELINEVEKDIKSIMGRIILEVVQNKVPENVITESIQDAWKQHAKH